MAKVNVSVPQGTRDFGPDVIRKRNFIFETIRQNFELYGYQPLETPAMENLETLMGKYGEEGDKLIFRILNNGLNEPAQREKAFVAFNNVLDGRNDRNLTERALKYDLTIPFARYVAMNHGKLAMPFKRYQVQPVWRADKPQKGRYREFYQCDADVVGSYSLWNDAELAQIYVRVFRQLRITVDIKINSRKLLTALAEHAGDITKLVDITTAIDKLDKIGLEKVKAELLQRGLSETQVNTVEKYLAIEGTNIEKLQRISELLGANENSKKGLQEVEFVLGAVDQTGGSSVSFDPTLARGLNYYTGVIFEVKAVGVRMGSIGGGGRYDDLTGLFGVPNIPGVGISFGVDRIYDVMEELHLFPDDVHTGTQVLFFNLGESESRKAFELAQQLRDRMVRCELFPENVKMDRQFKYADKKNITFAVIIGSRELESGQCILKNLRSGQQLIMSPEELINFKF